MVTAMVVVVTKTVKVALALVVAAVTGRGVEALRDVFVFYFCMSGSRLIVFWQTLAGFSKTTKRVLTHKAAAINC